MTTQSQSIIWSFRARALKPKLKKGLADKKYTRFFYIKNNGKSYSASVRSELHNIAIVLGTSVVQTSAREKLPTFCDRIG